MIKTTKVGHCCQGERECTYSYLLIQILCLTSKSFMSCSPWFTFSPFYIWINWKCSGILSRLFLLLTPRLKITHSITTDAITDHFRKASFLFFLHYNSMTPSEDHPLALTCGITFVPILDIFLRLVLQNAEFGPGWQVMS